MLNFNMECLKLSVFSERSGKSGPVDHSGWGKEGDCTKECKVEGLSQNGKGTIMTYDLLSYDLMVI